MYDIFNYLLLWFNSGIFVFILLAFKSLASEKKKILAGLKSEMFCYSTASVAWWRPQIFESNEMSHKIHTAHQDLPEWLRLSLPLPNCHQPDTETTCTPRRGNRQAFPRLSSQHYSAE